MTHTHSYSTYRLIPRQQISKATFFVGGGFTQLESVVTCTPVGMNKCYIYTFLPCEVLQVSLVVSLPQPYPLLLVVNKA